MLLLYANRQLVSATAVCVAQVQASLRHIASTVLHDARLQLTHTRQQGSTQAGSSASILSAPPASNQGQQQQQQQMLSAAAQMAPGAVRELEGCMPVAAVCVKALQGWYWGLDAFQTDFEAAAQSLRCALLLVESHSVLVTKAKEGAQSCVNCMTSWQYSMQCRTLVMSAPSRCAASFECVDKE